MSYSNTVNRTEFRQSYCSEEGPYLQELLIYRATRNEFQKLGGRIMEIYSEVDPEISKRSFELLEQRYKEDEDSKG